MIIRVLQNSLNIAVAISPVVPQLKSKQAFSFISVHLSIT